MFIGEEIYITLDWDVIRRVLTEDERPPRPIGNDGSVPMPDGLWGLLQRCWAEPTKRITMSEVAVNLAEICPHTMASN